MTYIGWYHEKADVLRIPKMLSFLSFEGFKPELLAVKVRSNWKKKIPWETQNWPSVIFLRLLIFANGAKISQPSDFDQQ